MNALLDTHVVLWWLDDAPQLSRRHRDIVSDTDNICFVSSATVWEISIKKSLGKLSIPDDYLDILESQGIFELSVSWVHAAGVAKLPLHHRDPFDRMLVSQALNENLTILTVDNRLKVYGAVIL
jgi:PIN domain nuclease of toxin-antitoxin system